MPADRFETDLRDLLREEASAAPVVLSLGDLRSRAGATGRSRGWLAPGRLALGAAVAAIVVAAVALSVQPPRPGPGIGSSASVGATASPPGTAMASPVPLGSASPAPLLVSYGPAGTALTAFVSAADELAIIGVHRDGSISEIATVPGLSRLLGDWHIANPDIDLTGAISPTRFVALRVARGENDEGAATALVDLSGRSAHATILPAGPFAFLPDGTLVIAGDGRLTRFAWPYDSPGVMTSLPRGISLDTVGDRPSITDDASGVYGLRAESSPNGDPAAGTSVVVHWDGAVDAADPARDPLLVTGADRPFGADGQRAFEWADDAGPGGTSSSGLAVEGPTTPRVETKFTEVQGYEWAPGGRTLIILSGGAVWSFDGAKRTKIGTLLADDQPRGIVGFTPTAVLVQSSGGLGTYAVRLDGSGHEALGGTLIGVVG
jgi:hypothetical protein